MSQGPVGNLQPQLPAPRLTVPAWLCPGRQAGRSSMGWRPNWSGKGRAGEEEGGYTGVRGDRWRWGGIGVTKGRMGCWVRGKEDGAAPGGTEFFGGLGMEWGD